MPHRFAVGEPYHADRKIWPECSQLHWMDGELDLVLFIDRPSRHEAEAVGKGKSEFALFDRDGLVIVLYFFDGQRTTIPWSDASYQWHLVPADRRALPPAGLAPESRAKLYLTLVNAQGGLVERLRLVSLSPEFTRAIFEAIASQAATPWAGRAAYDAQIAKLYRRYPNSADMLVDCSTRCHGGA